MEVAQKEKELKELQEELVVLGSSHKQSMKLHLATFAEELSWLAAKLTTDTAALKDRLLDLMRLRESIGPETASQALPSTDLQPCSQADGISEQSAGASLAAVSTQLAAIAPCLKSISEQIPRYFQVRFQQHSLLKNALP